MSSIESKLKYDVAIISLPKRPDAVNQDIHSYIVNFLNRPG